MKTTTIISGALVAITHICSAEAITHAQAHAANRVIRANLQVPSQVPTINAPRSQGCYQSKGNMTLEMNGSGVSSGSCNAACTKEKYYVIALQGTSCYCGFAYPPKNDLSSDSDCDYPCPAYGNEACGGLGQPGYYSIWNTGVNINPPFMDPPASMTSSSAAPSKTSTSPTDGSSNTGAVPTQTSAPSQTSQPKKDNGPSVAGIVAGTVAGVALIAGVAGGCFFLVRRRRNAEIEEEHRRNAAVNAFINGSKPPSTNGSISMTDSRLDPILAHRRLSDGSIADNEDYSRRILRVTNA